MPERYDPVSRLLHWTVAVLVLVQLASGWGWAGFAEASAPRLYLFRLHVFSGYSILILAITQIAWRLSSPVPPLPETLAGPLKVLAGASHALLYLAILAQPMLGVLSASSFGDRPGSWPGQAHALLAWAIAAMVILHVLAAFWHHFVRRDRLLHGMLP